MGSVVEFLNAVGRPFVGWSLAMLVQSSVLIAILLAIDLLIRRKVRAVVRYAIWSLVLVKLVLPPSVASPFGLAMFAPLESKVMVLFDAARPALQQASGPLVLADGEAPQGTSSDSAASTGRPSPGKDHGTAPSGVQAMDTHRSGVPLSWPGVVLAAWLIVALVLILLLGQRAVFVAGLVRQSRLPEASTEALLLNCCRQLAITRRPSIRISPNAVSPVVCGLARPTILMPEGLISELQPGQVRAVLLHELAHVKRGDMWVNLVQAALQIAYFYNPLVWLANWLIRRIREQAVDEAVLVAMGDRASDYPETLVHVARLALARPSLGLRLIGVVEHPTALRERIQTMVTRTVPTSAQLGLKGLALVLTLGLVVLPMAAAGTRGSSGAVKAEGIEGQQGDNRLQALVEAAEAGSTVTVPSGTYTQPVTISKALTLKGQSAGECILEVTADGPALTVDARGQGKVAISGLTLKWQLATSDKGIARPCALYVKDTEASVTGCRFVPLGNSQRSPVAVQIEGFSKATVSDCQSEGFDYVICCGKGTDGLVEDCVIRDCGHQGIINYEGSTLTVERCIVAGSQFHGLRCTGGTLTARDNLLLDNRISGVYLGNKNGRGTLSNNLMIHNGSGVAGFYQAEFKVENNVILDSVYSGIGMWDTCRLTLRNNILQANAKALSVYAKGGTKDTNTLGPNTFWSNTANTENCQLAAGSIEADPLFQDPNSGDFSLRPGDASQHKQGLSNPGVLRTLWSKATPYLDGTKKVGR